MIVRAAKKGAPAVAKKATASAKPAAAAKKPATKTTAAVVAKPKVMANYNRTLDLVALALTLGQNGKTVQAAKVFAAAIKHTSCKAAVNVINASNAVALQASKLRAAEEAEQDNELSDDELDQLLGQGEQVEADFGEDDEEGEGDEEEGEEGDGEEEGEEEDAGEEGDASEETLAKVLARLSGK